MRYFRVHDTGDDYDRTRWFLGVPRDGSAGKEDPWQFTSGEPLSTLSKRLTVAQRVKGTPQRLSFAAFDIPIVSADLATALYAIAQADIQLLPVHVEATDDAYFVLNVTTVIRCLDELASEFTKFPPGDEFGREGRYRMVTKLKILKTPLRDHQALRIDGWLSPLIVSNDVMALLAGFQIAGLCFEEV